MNDIDIRDYSELDQALLLAQHTVYKKYLQELSMYPVVRPTVQLLDEEAEDCLRFFQLKELSCKQGEDILQKLSTVYYASMSLGCNLIVMIDVEKINAPAKIYIGVRNDGHDEEAKSRLGTSFRTLKSGMMSNFPGTKISDIPARTEMPKLIEDIFGASTSYISAVSCVASDRNKTKTEYKPFVQGIERFIDTMKGNTYTALFIAEPITPSEHALMRDGYENLYSNLSSFEKSVWSYNENESDAVMNSLCKGISKSVTNGTSNTQSHTKSRGYDIGIQASLGKNSGTSIAIPTNIEKVGRVLSGVAGVAGVIGSAHPLIRFASGAVNAVGSVMQGNSVKTSVFESIGKTIGVSGGLNFGSADTESDTNSHSETKTDSESKTTGETFTRGRGKTLQIENVNKSIEQMLNHIEEQLARIREGEDYGAYSCAAYFLSGRQDSSLLAANTYRALIIGEGSSVESSAINSWNGQEEPEKVSAIKEYLKRCTHPLFGLSIVGKTESLEDFAMYTPGTTVSGLELPMHLGLPNRSVYGLPVLEHAEFGRNIIYRNLLDQEKSDTAHIGTIFHMGQVENRSSVDMDISELTAHTFIAGSTGSGKSNTIYCLLGRLKEKGIKFLVIEPAKGEYKDVVGQWADVRVFGTNPLIKNMEMLRINPFRFPRHIHVLEHLDRLVEIFNVCWPMYAAMPAILKDSVERAYADCGWDLAKSENKYDSELFPTFRDVVSQIREVLAESDYSADNKGDYTGSLVTRLKSLTNGINGLIFTADDIKDEDLFDKNVIVDLSRVGSSETKSLIMGLLVLKQQEYRMEQRVSGANMNDSLKHVTVLEEAHHLLKRTSTEQTGEGANLIGKSVEMLASSIAEMRTYGEGFVIADQSPGLLDMSVIRNTNTKIILRLPDLSDRELVGRAAGLTDNQIIELARLEKGVAVIHQSNWLEPVLCKIDKYDGEKSSTDSEKEILLGSAIRNVRTQQEEMQDASSTLLDWIMNKELYRKNDRVDIEKLKSLVLKSDLEAAVKCDFIRYINSDGEKGIESLRILVYDFLKAGKAMKEARIYRNIREWVHAVADQLSPSISGYSREQIDLVMALLIYEQSLRNVEYNDILSRYVELYKKEGGVF